MKFSLAAVALSLVSATVAKPFPPFFSHLEDNCLCQQEANEIVAQYAALQNHTASTLGGPRATARQLLSPAFQETSDSLNELLGLPLGSVTFPDKKTYIQAVLATSAAELDTIKILVSGCNYITWYWNAPNVGANPVKGFHLFEIDDNKQIAESWLEFNSIAWNEDIGGSCTIPNVASSAAA